MKWSCRRKRLRRMRQLGQGSDCFEGEGNESPPWSLRSPEVDSQGTKAATELWDLASPWESRECLTWPGRLV